MTILYIERGKNKTNDRIHLECDEKTSQVCRKTWSSRHIYYSVDKTYHTCHNCVRKRYASMGGKVAGRKAVESGQIHQFIAAAATPESRKKARDSSFKKGRRAFTSKVEDAVYAKCVEWFGDEVKRWQNIIRGDGKCCNIDIYIPSIDTYVEVDGVYWHGLDRDYDQLSDETKRKYDHDRVLDEHCTKHNIRLIRIRDQPDVSKGRWEEIRLRIESHRNENPTD